MTRRAFTLFVLLFATSAIACTRPVPVVAQGHGANKPSAPGPKPIISGALDTPAQVADAIIANYTKYEFRVAMRDGVKLLTHVYVPKDRSRSYPMMLQRTPYGIVPYGVDNYPTVRNPRTLRKFAPSTHFIRDGFIFVHQDVRGRMMSEGEFVDVRPITQGGVDESTDAWDTVDWLVKNVANNNGRVGLWGVSYPGFYAAQAAVNAHPAIKAVSPQAPVTDWFVGDDFHHNGAFFLADAFGFYSSFGKARPKPTTRMKWGFDYDSGDAYDFYLAMGPLSNANKLHLEGKVAFWNDLMEHGNLDAFWKARNPRPHYKNVKPAVMTVGGWYDAEDLFGALETYRAFESQSPGADNVLVMGPWLHGGWGRNDGDRHGDIHFGQKTSLFYREKIELPFFQRHLKDRRNHAYPEAWVFEVGTNVWQRYAQWPPKGAQERTYFLAADGKLTTAATTEAVGFDEYISDPAKPVPYLDALTVTINKNYMSDDQRFAARRPDVLVYQTEALEADVTLAGPVEASLWVSTTGTDADFIVKIIDVFPASYANREGQGKKVRMAGYQHLVRGEVMRGKFRNSFETPEPFKPGEPTLVRFRLPDISHSFRAGHKIMVQVQSSWFPLVDRNPQTFTDIYKAKASDFKKATHRLFHNQANASAVKFTLAP